MDIRDRMRNHALNMKMLPLKNASLPKKIAACIYFLLGRKAIGKLYVTSKPCGTCRACIRVCPNKGIISRFGMPFWTFKCKGCLICAAICPNKSIEVSVLKIVIALVMLFVPFDGWVEAVFKFKFSEHFGIFYGNIVLFLVWCAGYSAAFFIIDRVLFLLFNITYLKKMMNLKFFKKIRDTINPLTIFPVMVTEKNLENLLKARAATGKNRTT